MTTYKNKKECDIPDPITLIKAGLDERFVNHYIENIAQHLYKIDNSKKAILTNGWVDYLVAAWFAIFSAFLYPILILVIFVYLLTISIFGGLILLGIYGFFIFLAHSCGLVLFWYYVFFIFMLIFGFKATILYRKIKRQVIFYQNLYLYLYPNVTSYFGNGYSFKNDKKLLADILTKTLNVNLREFTISNTVNFKHNEIDISMCETKEYINSEEKNKEFTISHFIAECFEMSTSYEKFVHEAHYSNEKIKYAINIYIIADIHKSFNGKTLIKKDGGIIVNNLINNLNSLYEKKILSVALEDPEFESIFQVYSSDEVEARYLCTPSLMQRLVELHYSLNRNIECYFVDQKFVVRINLLDNESFLSHKSPIEYNNYYTDIVNQTIIQIKKMISVIEALKITNKTGL